MTADSLVRLIERRAEASPDRIALSVRTEGEWRELSYAQLFRRICALGSKLIELGVSRGSHVAILSESRPEWAIGFFATLFAGGIVVPLDPHIENEELQRIVEHCQPRVILLSPAFRSRELPRAAVLHLDAANPPSREYDSRDRLDDVALLAYTSGTTGSPKGVMITGASLLYEARSLANLHNLREDDVFLSVLPLNHLLELTCGLVAVIGSGAEILYPGTLLPTDLIDVMYSRRVTSMIGVPALYRTLKKALESAYSNKLAHLLARFLPHRRLRRLIFSQIHDRAGGRVYRLISGGSPLDNETLSFFDRLGTPIYQGYGLTETSPVATVNAPAAYRHGSVGRPLPGTQVAIAADGEILIRGPQLMRGYYKSPDLTADVIDADGWLHTGDLGRIENGFLYVTGRIKDLIVPADGRKVHPDEVEAVLCRSAKVKELCIIGLPSERGEEVCAVVVPCDGVGAQEVEREVRALALELRNFKRPRHVIVRQADLPRTRTMKVRRGEVQNWVAEAMTR